MHRPFAKSGIFWGVSLFKFSHSLKHVLYVDIEKYLLGLFWSRLWSFQICHFYFYNFVLCTRLRGSFFSLFLRKETDTEDWTEDRTRPLTFAEVDFFLCFFILFCHNNNLNNCTKCNVYLLNKSLENIQIYISIMPVQSCCS